jgi:hypothetical protein
LNHEVVPPPVWLTTLANIQTVDLETACPNKYFKNAGPKGHK